MLCKDSLELASNQTHQIQLKEEFEDAKGVIRMRISKNRQHNGQKKKYKRTNNDLQNIHIKLKLTQYKDTKGVIRIRKSKKNRQYNGQKKRDKRTNNDLQNIHIKQSCETDQLLL